MSKLFFFIQEAFRALRRNAAPSMAAIVTTVVTVVLLGVLIPIFQPAQAKSDEVRDSLEFRVSVYDDATASEIAALRGELEAIPHVASLEFIDTAEALAAVRAAVPPPGPDGKSQPISPIIPTKDGIFDRREDQQKIEQVTSTLKIILTVITALLISASLMLVGNTIRLSIYTRRREVEVMRLVGATRWFIRWPFMIEGIVVGFVGGLAAILTLWLGKVTVIDPLDISIGAQEGTLSFPALAAILFGAAVLVSAIGSGITLRRFLRV